jgi:hypothetical protein
MLNPRPRLVLMLYAAAAVVAAVSFTLMPWWTVDDAFISYRYGSNLLFHGQLTWNVGSEPLVEGYTGIFLPLLAAGTLATGLPLLETIKLLGLLSMFGTIWMMCRTLRRLGTGPIGQGLAVLGMASTPLLYMHSISGLETIFFTFFICSAIFGLWRINLAEMGIRRSAECAIFLFMSGICRPEGILLAALVTVTLLAFSAKHRFKFSIFLQFLPIGGALALLLVYWLWRTAYYGNFFPNSYHAKVFDGLINWESMLALGKFAGYYCFLPTVTGLALFFGNPRRKFRLPSASVLASLSFVAICWTMYAHSNLWMNYGSRFFFPFLPLFVVGIIAFISRNWQQIQSSESQNMGAFRKLRLLLWGFALIQVCILGFRFRQEWTFLNYYHAIVQEELIPVGRYLAAELDPEATVISYMDAGAVGYYSERKIVDFGRLSDPYLAKTKPALPQVLDYFFSIDADAVVMTSQAENEFQYIEEAAAIVSDPRFEVFVLARQWGNSVGFPYWQRVYLRQR